MVALRQIAHSFGGVAELVERTKLNATTLYRTLSTQGNRELRGMAALLKATDIRPAVQPIRKAAR